MKLKFLWFLLISLATIPASAQEVIPITRFGAIPNSQTDVMPAVKQALEYCKDKSDIVISFPEGRYDFWPTRYADKTDSIGFDLQKMNDLTIDGNGSEFIFHGWMEIAHVDSCFNILFKNFSVDWDRPLISQAEITKSTYTIIYTTKQTKRSSTIVGIARLVIYSNRKPKNWGEESYAFTGKHL